MATIKLKRGTSAPTTSNIVDGEVAVDKSSQKLYIRDGSTIKEIGRRDSVPLSGGTMTGSLTVGADDTGYDVKFFGATSGSYMLWDESADDLILGGAAKLGVGATPDVRLHIQENGEPPAEGMFILEANSSQRQLRIQPPTDSDNGFIDYRGGNLLFLDDGSEVARFQGSTSFNLNGKLHLYTTDDQANYYALYTHIDDSFRINYNNTGSDELVMDASGNMTLLGSLTAASLDISGNVDIDGTLEADAITVDGTALSSVITGTTVDNATLAATVTVTNSTANTNFPIVFHNESNGLLDDTGALRYNPSTGELLVPKLTVAGTTTTADTVTMQAANAIAFEGATADAYETTLSIVDPTADHTQYLINQGGYIPLLASATTTTITATPEELNILDGVTATTAELNYSDTGASLGTVVASKVVTVDANKDAASFRNITLTGALTAASLDISGDVDIDGTTNLDVVDIDGAVDMASTLTVAGNITFGDGHTIGNDGNDDLVIASSANENLHLDSGEVIYLDHGTASTDSVYLRKAASTYAYFRNSSDDFLIGTSGDDHSIFFQGSDGGSLINMLRLDASLAGKATFAGEVVAASLDISGNVDVDGTTNLDVVDIDGAVDMASTLAVGGVVTANAGVVVDNITIDGTEIDLSSGALTLDVAGDINLDSDGGNVMFKDGGTEIGLLANTSSNFVLMSRVDDKDIIFKGKDDGSTITALTLDMSAAGAATFNDKIIATELDISGNVDIDGTTNLDVVDIDGAVDMASTLTVAGVLTGSSLDISGDIDVDGTANLDVVDIDGAVDMASTLSVGGNVTVSSASSPTITLTDTTNTTSLKFYSQDGEGIVGTYTNHPLELYTNSTLALTLSTAQVATFAGEVEAASLDISGDADIDGTTNLDAVDIDGAVDMASTLTVGGLTTLSDNVTANNLSITSGNWLGFGDYGERIAGSNSASALYLYTDATIALTLDSSQNATFAGEVAAASLDISGNVDIDGTLETDAFSINGTSVTSTAAELNILDGVTATATELNYSDTGAAVGTVVASKVVTVDANKDASSFRNVTLTGALTAASLDISGDVDIDGTLEADAITVNGSTLSSVITGTTVDNATLAATVTVTDSTANTNFPVVFHNESNGLLDDTGALRYNPSTGELLVPNLTVSGTTTTANTVTMQAANAIVFEGATADSHETTLSIVDPTADHTQYLVNQGGYIPVLAAATTTAITATPEELNILDGVTSTASELNILDGVTSTASELNILDGVTATTAELNILDGVTSTASELNILDGVTATTAELNILDGVTSTASELNILDGVTATAAEINTLDGITAVVGELNALDLGSTAVGTAIASKAVVLDSNKDYTGIRNLTLTGDIDVDGTTNLDAVDIDGAVDMASTLAVTGDATFAGHIELADSKYVKLGADGDFILYHDGTSNYIQAVKENSDIIFRGNDDGTSANFLTLDTSAGGDATFAGSIFTTDLEVRGSGGGATNRLKATYNSSTGVAAFGPDSGGGSTSLQIGTSNSGSYATALTLDSSQNATFAGKITATAAGVNSSLYALDLTRSGSGSSPDIWSDSNNLVLGTSDSTAVLTLLNSDATFAGNITFGDGHTIGDDGNDDLVIASSSNENLHLDSGEVIYLDHGSASTDSVYLRQAANTYGYFRNSSDDLVIGATDEDHDIFFQGNDGGSTINMLKLDASAGGDATFSGTVTAGTVLTVNAPDGGGSPAMTATLNLHGYEGRGAGIKIKDSVNSASGASDREWFIGTGYSQSGFNIGYASDGSQSSYSAQSKLSIGTDGNATFAGEVAATALDISGDVDIDGTLETDAISINGTTVSATAAELNVLDPSLKENSSIWIGSDPSGSTNSAAYNTALGVNALDAIETADRVTAIGYNALSALTTGSSNTAVGDEALLANTQGNSNIAVGGRALTSNTVGDRNTAVGYQSLYTMNPAGSADMYNTAVGYSAGYDLTVGVQNTLIGGYAGEEISIGNYNTHVGYNAGGGISANAATGDYNTSVGRNALSKIEGSGQANTALGFGTLENMTTASNNVAVGGAAMQVLQTGNDNVAVGNYAGDAITHAGLNTLVGYAAGSDLLTSQYNVAVGHSALKNATTGDLNIAIGYKALHDNEVGDRNTAIGYEALRELEPSSKDPDMYNVALGFKAGTPATSTTAFTGIQNTLLGSFAGAEITTSNGATVIGYEAGGGSNVSRSAPATGEYNTAIGYAALTRYTSAHSNVAVGTYAAEMLTEGDQNVYVGNHAGEEATTAEYNAVVGYNAGGGGATSATTGNYNAALGFSALESATSAGSNTSVGAFSMEANLEGSNSVCVGYKAGQAITEGNANTLVGYSTGVTATNLQTGAYNTLVGAYCDTTATDSEKAVGIGYNLDCEAGYTTVGEGSNDIRAAHGTATWNTVSDERYKTDIVDSSAGLNFINALRPRTFRYKTLGELPETFRAYEAGSTEVFKNSETNHGFIAQEVKAAIDADDSIKDGFKLWDTRDDGSQEVAESALIPVLVKAIQEQQALIEALTARIKKLEGE